MGCQVQCVVLLSSLLCLCVVWTQNLRQRDALCSEDGCYVLYFQRKIFLDAWRSCKELGGDLATIRQTKEEEMVERLFSNVELGPNHRGKVQIWIGLQRQPRQCAPTRPLRGFSWVTGDQDTQYTNWLQDDSANSCSSPHCVVISYSTAPHDQGNNLKWKDRTCSISVDGYLCKYTFRGMCTSIASEGGGNTLYSTPFNLLSTVLTHVPFGSVATVPCPDKEDQSVVCMQKKDGTFDWNSDPPVCSVAPKSSWCDQDNGGCHQLCIEDRAHYYCDCNDGFLLAEDGVSCFLSDPCKESPCEFECLPVMDSYRCACPDGSMLAPDEHHCIDLDECLQRPCEQICVNAPGTFKCRCREGYQLDEDGVCEDMDECVDNPCEHACENTFGSYICHCRLGYAPLQEDQSRCCDIDECQIEGNCEQMCINYEGGFACYCEEGYNLQLDQYSCTPIGENLENPTTTESNPWITRSPIWEPEDSIHPWNPANESDWREYLYWQTETDNIKIPTDILLLTLTTEKEAEKTTPIETPPEFNNAGSSNTNTEVTNVFFSPTISTLTQNYNEEESTTVPTVSPYYTFAGGARNWLRFSSTQTVTETGTGTAKNPIDFIKEYDSYEHGNEYTKHFDNELATFSPDKQISTGFPKQETKEANSDYDNNNEQRISWLLFGLLVPICIFIVVMVVLGIIYCTRYTVKQQNRNTSECYHWIAGAGDKATAEISSSGTKSHV
ncbi:Endosialin Tumor endothelial marker 1 [Triplophysa tibetana]|uniref:Endosialin Tumor endothelial marker 1 n=1 Tax=Triplophysa tibetana TaxID=1572043 RepID=A0A5A9PTM9_9TELE|nr:Endosialin Tumor endothelial marker 1 [Triplophysa tibetana]